MWAWRARPGRGCTGGHGKSWHLPVGVVAMRVQAPYMQGRADPVMSSFYLFVDLRERNVHLLLLPLVMHPLVGSSMCPDRDLDLNT